MGNDSGDRRFSIDEPPWITANHRTLIEKQIDITPNTLGMNESLIEHFDMHQLVFIIAEYLIKCLAVFVFKMRIALFSLTGHPFPDFGIHRVIGATAINSNPSEFLSFRPIGELSVRSGMFDHVADLVSCGLVPAVMMESGMDEQDISILHFHAVL